MNKDSLTKFISNLKKAKIDQYTIRFEGGNRFITNNTESQIIELTDDCAIVLETNNNYKPDGSRFNIKCVPYENIDTATAFDITTQQAIDFLKAEGIYTDAMKELIKTQGGRVILQPGHGGYGDIHDKDGKPVFPSDEAARITTGSDK